MFKRIAISTALAGGLFAGVLGVAGAANASYEDATGNSTWGLSLDTKKLRNGRHTLEARASDGTAFSDTATVQFTVDNPAGGQGLSALSILGVFLIVLAVAGAAAFVYLRRMPRRPRKYDWGPD